MYVKEVCIHALGSLKTANIVGKELNVVVRGMGRVCRVLLQPTIWCWVGVECSYALKGEEMNFSIVWRPRLMQHMWLLKEWQNCFGIVVD